MNKHFKDVHTLYKLLQSTSENNRLRLCSLLLDITRAKTIDNLTECACDIDFLLDSISKESNDA